MTHDQTIKMIETKGYNIALIEGSDYKYYVRSENSFTEEVSWSQGINDYHMASYIFDLRVNDITKKN